MADTYAATIETKRPTCVVFLIDQSGSMCDPIAGSPRPMTKADSVARAVNICLDNFVGRSTKDEVRRYFDMAVIGYGKAVGPAWTGTLAGKEWVSIVDVAETARTIDVPSPQHEGRPIKLPVWFDPVADGSTPMCEALRRAQKLVSSWLDGRKQTKGVLDMFPPIVVNITDGESTDGNPVPIAQEIMSLETEDGHVLVFNCHITDNLSAGTVSFPASSAALTNEPARTLFEMSSVLPATLRKQANLTIPKEQALGEGARGMVFNAGVDGLSLFLDVGTKAHPDKRER